MLAYINIVYTLVLWSGFFFAVPLGFTLFARFGLISIEASKDQTGMQQTHEKCEGKNTQNAATAQLI